MSDKIHEYIKKDYIEYDTFQPNLNRYTTLDFITYELQKPPKLQQCETIDEFIKAKNYLKGFYKWTDEELLSDFVKVSCMSKRFCNIPTKKDLEGAIRKINKKLKK
jgi:hypothetical protein